MAEEDAKVGEHARDVSGSHDRAAKGGSHRVLQATGARSEVVAELTMAVEQRHGAGEQHRFEAESDPVTAAELQRRVADDVAADGRAAHKRTEHREKMESGGGIEPAQRDAEERSSTGEMGNGLVVKAEQTDDVDHAGDECEGPRTGPHPTRKAADHVLPVSRPEAGDNCDVDVVQTRPRRPLLQASGRDQIGFVGGGFVDGQGVATQKVGEVDQLVAAVKMFDDGGQRFDPVAAVQVMDVAEFLSAAVWIWPHITPRQSRERASSAI